MVFGRLFHYGFDAIAISTIVAGIKKTTGYGPQTSLIPDDTLRGIADSYFGAGESCFTILSSLAVSSHWFAPQQEVKKR